MDDFGKDAAENAEDEIEKFSLDDILMEFADETEVQEDSPLPESEEVDFESTGGVESAVINSAEEPAEPEPEPAPPAAGPEPEPETEPVKTDYDIVREYKPVGAGDLDELLKEVRMDFVTDDEAAPAEYAAEEAPEEPAAEDGAAAAQPQAEAEPPRAEAPKKPRETPRPRPRPARCPAGSFSPPPSGRTWTSCGVPGPRRRVSRRWRRGGPRPATPASTFRRRPRPSPSP